MTSIRLDVRGHSDDRHALRLQMACSWAVFAWRKTMGAVQVLAEDRKMWRNQGPLARPLLAVAALRHGPLFHGCLHAMRPADTHRLQRKL